MEELVSEKGMRVFEDFFGRARGAGLDGDDGGEDGDGDGRKAGVEGVNIFASCLRRNRSRTP